MGQQPLFEVVAPAAHVRAALATAQNDTVAGDDERNLAQANKRRIHPRGSGRATFANVVQAHLDTQAEPCFDVLSFSGKVQLSWLPFFSLPVLFCFIIIIIIILTAPILQLTAEN